MKPNCPHCFEENKQSDRPDTSVRYGFFRRSSDSRKIQRFRCRKCMRVFSRSTDHPCKWQKKRRFNHLIWMNYASGMSKRRAAIVFNLNRKTVSRTIDFLGAQSELALNELNTLAPPAGEIQFDDLETFEHSKHQPLSVTLAVAGRRILAFEVSQMAARGRLAQKARKKYGKRKDERWRGRQRLFKKLQPLVMPDVIIKSDQNPYYPKDIKDFFPLATHIAFKGVRGSLGGQGELKKTGHDPLFYINHTYAMLRANINRLFRKTWCTTKCRRRLRYHIAIFALFNNLVLLDQS